jgi:hypothetical protein
MFPISEQDIVQCNCNASITETNKKCKNAVSTREVGLVKTSWAHLGIFRVLGCCDPYR